MFCGRVQTIVLTRSLPNRIDDIQLFGDVYPSSDGPRDIYHDFHEILEKFEVLKESVLLLEKENKSLKRFIKEMKQFS